MRTQRYPFPDFGIRKQCRDHGAFLEWQRRWKLGESRWAEMGERGPGRGEWVVEVPSLTGEWVGEMSGEDEREEGV